MKAYLIKTLQITLALVLAIMLALACLSGLPLAALATDAATPQPSTADSVVATPPGAEEVAPALLATSSILPAQPQRGDVAIDAAHFPDANFRAYVKEVCDTNHDGVLQSFEQVIRTVVECGGRNIQSLDGLQYFFNLQTLDCSHNNLVELDISANTQLVSLTCHNNQLAALDVGQSSLQDLTCAYNNLATLKLPASILSVNCRTNPLISLDVSQATALRILECSYTNLAALDVAPAVSLQKLLCQRSQLTSLDLGTNSALEFLWCHNNRLTSLDVSRNPALTTLSCAENKLTSLDLRGKHLKNSIVSPQRVVGELSWSNGRYVSDIKSLVGAGLFWAVSGVTTLVDEKSSWDAAAGLLSWEKLPSNWAYGYETQEASGSVGSMEVRVEPICQTITAATGGHGAINPPGETVVLRGSSMTYAFVPDAGYELAVVTVNDRPVTPVNNTLTLESVREDIVLYAAFTPVAVAPPMYNAKASAGANGTINPSGVTPIIEGGSQVYTFSPEAGYELGVVLVNGAVVTPENNRYTLADVRADATIHATFKKGAMPPDPPTPPVPPTDGGTTTIVVPGTATINNHAIVERTIFNAAPPAAPPAASQAAPLVTPAPAATSVPAVAPAAQAAHVTEPEAVGTQGGTPENPVFGAKSLNGLLLAAIAVSIFAFGGVTLYFLGKSRQPKASTITITGGSGLRL
ncbi:MAG: leucine-rich repeat domain-containing protein [Raoultibacter sp.]